MRRARLAEGAWESPGRVSPTPAARTSNRASRQPERPIGISASAPGGAVAGRRIARSGRPSIVDIIRRALGRNGIGRASLGAIAAGRAGPTALYSGRDLIGAGYNPIHRGDRPGLADRGRDPSARIIGRAPPIR